MPFTQLQWDRDAHVLRKVLVDLCGVPDDAGYDTHPLVLALKKAMISGFYLELLTLGGDDMLRLDYVDPTDNQVKTLPLFFHSIQLNDL